MTMLHSEESAWVAGERLVKVCVDLSAGRLRGIALQKIISKEVVRICCRAESRVKPVHFIVVQNERCPNVCYVLKEMILILTQANSYKYLLMR